MLSAHVARTLNDIDDLGESCLKVHRLALLNPSFDVI